MPQAFSRSSGQIGEFGLLVVLWGLSIGAVYWDLKRRFLPRPQRLAWLAIVGLLPGAGLAVYLLSRLIGQVFPLPSTGAAPRRVTELKRSPEAAVRTGTIAAADLVKETIADRQAAPPSAAPPMAVKLSVIAGPHAGQEFSLEALPARLGRGGEATLRLDRDLGISRQHAELYRQDGLLRIRDLDSSHGLSVNGVIVHDQALQLGDKIEAGLSALIVKEAGA